MPLEPDALCECDNCGLAWRFQDLPPPARDLETRLDPGSIVPAGECPDCGALCYPMTDNAAGETDE